MPDFFRPRSTSRPPIPPARPPRRQQTRGGPSVPPLSLRGRQPTRGMTVDRGRALSRDGGADRSGSRGRDLSEVRGPLRDRSQVRGPMRGQPEVRRPRADDMPTISPLARRRTIGPSDPRPTLSRMPSGKGLPAMPILDRRPPYPGDLENPVRDRNVSTPNGARLGPVRRESYYSGHSGAAGEHIRRDGFNRQFKTSGGMYDRSMNIAPNQRRAQVDSDLHHYATTDKYWAYGAAYAAEQEPHPMRDPRTRVVSMNWTPAQAAAHGMRDDPEWPEGAGAKRMSSDISQRHIRPASPLEDSGPMPRSRRSSYATTSTDESYQYF